MPTAKPTTIPDNAQSDRRRQREAATEPPKAATATHTAPEVSLDTVFGAGENVTINGKDYRLAPFVMSRLQRAQELFYVLPFLLQIAVQVGEGADGEPDYEAMARLMTQFNAMAKDQDAKADDLAETISTVTEEVTAEMMEAVWFGVCQSITEDATNAMVDLIAISLSRRHPEITHDDVADEVDLPSAIRLIRRIMSLNAGMKRRFTTPL